MGQLGLLTGQFGFEKLNAVVAPNAEGQKSLFVWRKFNYHPFFLRNTADFTLFQVNCRQMTTIVHRLGKINRVFPIIIPRGGNIAHLYIAAH